MSLTPTGQQFVDLAMTQKGDRYLFGAEVAAGWAAFTDATVWDCAELTERTSALLGVYLPDGSQNQRRFCTKHITVAKARTIPGALLFSDTHVAISRGDGTTIEARNRRDGVGVFSVGANRFTDAALVPGFNYFPVSFQPAAPPPSGSLAEMRQILFFAKQFTLGVPDGPGVLNEHAPGGVEATKLAQAGLNGWFDRFARMTGAPNPDDHAYDGVWEGWTHDATVLMQKIAPATAEMGTFGSKSWRACYPS